jgi:hypothetical protein
VAQLAIDKDFLDDYSKLEKSVRVAVKAADVLGPGHGK